MQIPTKILTDNYYKNVLETYYGSLKLKIDDKTLKVKLVDDTLEGYFFNYGVTEGLYQYYLKYYYNVCLNFTSFLAIYSGDMLPFMVFEHTTNVALNKLFKFVEEQSIDMIRYELSDLSKISKEYDIDIQFVWRARHDEKTCQICQNLDNQIFTWAPNLAHPNCRCELEMIITEL